MALLGKAYEGNNRTLSADEVIGEILDANNVFVPIAVGPFGEFGSLFRWFIERHRVLPLPTFSTDQPNATRAAERAITNRTPYDVFGKADLIWKDTHRHKLFDGSYLSQQPSIWANQRLGLATSTHLANHINTSLTKVKQVCPTDGNNGTRLDKPASLDEDVDEWSFYDGELYNNSQHAMDDVDMLYTAEDGIDPFPDGPTRRGVS
ncbi:hypothetical protein ACHAWO_005713 [Cyclotella atomus]|uniref:Uncharacterized protein n=1 Tax=Cyclotella atomus TaxID=382360 RepID=A0ABD3N4Q2_9STRA